MWKDFDIPEPLRRVGLGQGWLYSTGQSAPHHAHHNEPHSVVLLNGEDMLQNQLVRTPVGFIQLLLSVKI